MNHTTPAPSRWHALAWAALALSLAALLGLWAWNTLAPPFGAPALQFRHALAAALLLGLARSAVAPHRCSRRHALRG